MWHLLSKQTLSPVSRLMWHSLSKQTLSPVSSLVWRSLSKQTLSPVSSLMWRSLSKQTLSPVSSLMWRSLSKQTLPSSLSLFKDVLEPDSESALQFIDLMEYSYMRSILMELKKASIKEILNSRVKEITFEGKVVVDTSPLGSTLYVRDFYSRLYDQLFNSRRAILIGNPGISKSWFHWYILYKLLHDADCPFKVIIRQAGQQKMAFIFPQHCQVFQTRQKEDWIHVLERIKPDIALYLVESLDSLQEPIDTVMKTIITCSPDMRRYHEFNKKGGEMYYMPVWELDELLSVGGHIQSHITDEELKQELTPEKIKARYHQFGGIFRYVIPDSLAMIRIAKRNQ